MKTMKTLKKITKTLTNKCKVELEINFFNNIYDIII